MATQRIPGFCALCRSRCGCISVVEDGRLVAVEPDPSHPTGKSLCVKGRAAPELVDAGDRLLHPLRRTRPKGDPDPGWIQITWDEALDWTADRMRQVAARHGAEAVAFAVTTPSGTAMSDSLASQPSRSSPIAAIQLPGTRTTTQPHAARTGTTNDAASVKTAATMPRRPMAPIGGRTSEQGAGRPGQVGLTRDLASTPPGRDNRATRPVSGQR